MGWTVSLVDEEETPIRMRQKHNDIGGGIRCIGGTDVCSSLITYNYARFFVDAFGNEDGIRTLDKMDCDESVEVIEGAALMLIREPSGNHWDPCPGNARKSLEELLLFAMEKRSGGKWLVL